MLSSLSLHICLFLSLYVPGVFLYICVYIYIYNIYIYIYTVYIYIYIYTHLFHNIWQSVKHLGHQG